MKGQVIYTDKEHERAVREVFPSQQMPGAERLIVSDRVSSGFLGFGAAITPSSCYELNRMAPDERDRLLREIYSGEGIGLAVGRLCIGSSDYSPELYSYDDVPMDLSLEHFSVERDEKYVIPMIREILKIRPDLYLVASPWSPPGWMKTGGRLCGGYMRSEFVDCYAEYIVKFIRAYEERGIRISAITPQNECETQQDGRMPACIWTPEIEADFIKSLRRKLDEQGLGVEIWMYDHNFNGVDRVLWSLEKIQGLREACDGVAFHYYGGAVEQTVGVTERFPEMKLHFTEGGPRLTDHYDTDWSKWGLMAVKALKAGYRSFTGWNLMLDETGGPNIGPFIGICGGLVTRDSRSGEISRSGQYKVFSHMAPYISKTSKIHPVSTANTFNPNMSAYPGYDRPIEGVLIENEDGRRAAVLVNPNARGVQTQIEMGGTLWYVELRADSIATVIVE